MAVPNVIYPQSNVDLLHITRKESGRTEKCRRDSKLGKFRIRELYKKAQRVFECPEICGY